MVNRQDTRPLVSVVMPVYNREQLISGAVDSVLEQSYDPLELNVVDDGSTDGTMDVLLEYSDPRLNIFQLESNQGANAARNLGIENGSGKYVAFLDSDDRWYPTKLEKQIDRFSKASPEVGVVYCGRWTNRRGMKLYRPPLSMSRQEGDLSDQVLRFNTIGFVDSVIRRDVLENVLPLDEDLPALQDWDLHIQLASITRYAFVEEPLLEVHHQESSISRDRTAYARAHHCILEKREETFRANDRALTHLYFRLGSSECLSGSSGEGRKYLWKALKRQPMNPLYIAAYLCSLPGTWLFRSVYAGYDFVCELTARAVGLLKSRS